MEQFPTKHHNDFQDSFDTFKKELKTYLILRLPFPAGILRLRSYGVFWRAPLNIFSLGAL